MKFKTIKKYLKNIYKVLLCLFLVGVIFPSLISLVLLLPPIQTYLANRVIERLSYDLEATVSIDRIIISPFTGIVLTDFLVCDQNENILFFTKELRTGIDKFSFRKKSVALGKIVLDYPEINLIRHEDEMNYEFIIRALSQIDNQEKWNYSLEGLLIRNGKLTLNTKMFEDNKFISDTLIFRNLILDLDIFSDLHSNSVIINSLSADENVGLRIKDFSSKIVLSSDTLKIDRLFFRTNNSTFDLACFEIQTEKSDTLSPKTSFKIEITQLMVGAADIKLFYADFIEPKLPLSFSGTINGSSDNIKGNDISIGFGEISNLTANFDISNLTDLKEAFIYLDVKTMQISIDEIEQFFWGNDYSKSRIPPFLKNLGIVHYKGNYSGYFDDIVAFGLFETNLGKINTDLGIKIKDDKNVIFSGMAKTKDFKIGSLMVNENSGFDKISFDIEINGNYTSLEDYFAFVAGDISAFDFNQYQYNNIVMNGLLTNRKFDGFLKLDDPNGQLNFLGKVDMSEKIPRFNFLATIENAHLDKLNLVPFLENSVLTITIETNLEGMQFNDLAGEINIQNGLLLTPDTEIELDMLTLKSFKTGKGKKFTLESNIAEGEMEGDFNLQSLNHFIGEYIDKYVPSANPKKNIPTAKNFTPHNFEFNIRLKEINPIVSLFFPDISISNSGTIQGKFNSKENKFDVVGELNHFRYKNIETQSIGIEISGNNEQTLTSTTKLARLSVGNFAAINNVSINQIAYNDTILTNLFWNNLGSPNYSGALYSDITFGQNSENERIMKVKIEPSEIFFADSLWNVKKSELLFHAKGFEVKEFGIESNNRFITLDGFQDKETDDNIKLMFKNFDLNRLLPDNQFRNLSFAGIINGEINMQNYFQSPLISANIRIDDFIFNRAEMGCFWVNSSWNKDIDALSLTTALTSKGNAQIIGAGYYYPKNQNVDLAMDIDSLSIAFLNPFLQKVLQNITGTATGEMFFSGPIKKPFLTGKVKLNDGDFKVDLLNMTYTLTDSVTFLQNEIRFNNMTVNDKRGHKGKFYGSIQHSSFKNLEFNLHLEADNMLLMNTTYRENPLYYGTLYGTGAMHVTGTTDNANLVINARTRPNSKFFIPMKGSETAMESGFVHFMSDIPTEKSNEKLQNVEEVSGLKIDLDVEVTPDAEIQIIFDERLGDILKGTGAGNIQIRIDRSSNIRLYGDYTIEQGEYFFSLQNLINRKFTINQGGTLRWQGDPQNATINLTAVYKAKASLSDLYGDTQTNEHTRRRVPINCNLILSENLRQPIIKFDIQAPDLDESTETFIRSFITSDEEMNRQVISLLLFNSFYTPEYMRSDASQSQTRNEMALFATTADMLMSQLSRWVSTISELDVGVSYRMGDDLTSEEFELALSTQILNNRVTLNTNVGYGKYLANNASKMIGDFDIDVKLNRSGTIRAKAYTHSNEYLIYETSPYKQGVGLSFREEYNKFGDLIRKYKNYFVRRKEDK
ncbi:MAG: translocation/assembly module TamB [Marinilabiliaceae bacterium]|nr:translocation/assembly module TamB [Marinilabiliaceae bacterium]